MSTQQTHYIVFGVNLGEFEDNFANKQSIPEKDFDSLAYDHSKGQYGIVADGMNGDYVLFGKIVEKSEEYDGMPFTELNERAEDSVEFFNQYHKYFTKPLAGHLIPHFFCFTHWH